MPQLPFRLPSKTEAVVIVIVFLAGLLFLSRREVKNLRAELNARPLIIDKIDTDYIRSVKRGPVKKTVKTTVLPDGTKTIENTEEVASEDTKIERREETTHSEAPAPAFRPTRYVGFGIDPMNYKRPRFRAGVTLFGRVDLGAAYDTRFRPLDGAVQAECTYRF